MANSQKKTEYNRQYMSRIAVERLAQKLCKVCGLSPLVTKVMCRECRDKENRAQNARWKVIRREVLDHYGAPFCACCKERFAYEFLHLDHINGGGNNHRRSLSSKNVPNAATMVYRELRRKGYPPGFQTLCANCNMAKGLYGECPHQSSPEELSPRLTGLMSFGC